MRSSKQWRRTRERRSAAGKRKKAVGSEDEEDGETTKSTKIRRPLFRENVPVFREQMGTARLETEAGQGQ